MAQYMIATYSAAGEAHEPMTEEQMRQSYQQIGALEAEMKSAGAWVYSGRLHEPNTATVVRMSGGEVLTTDGPFAESKEHLGGFSSSRPTTSTPRSDGRRKLPRPSITQLRCRRSGTDRGPDG